MGPILRTADQGADTAVWLAATAAGVESTGGFWLDRRPRWEHKVPWTRLSGAEFVDAGAGLWAWCAARTGWDGPRRRRCGLRPTVAGRPGRPQPVKPYCSWAPMTAHSNMP